MPIDRPAGVLRPITYQPREISSPSPWTSKVVNGKKVYSRFVKTVSYDEFGRETTVVAKESRIGGRPDIYRHEILRSEDRSSRNIIPD